MNYYQFHIADWALHTSHLTLEEEGVYRRLLDYYYDTESPIPTETQPVIRRLRLKGYEETVSEILAEFFVLEADGWHNLRADSEIQAYNAKAEQARQNGKRGGRPKKNKDLPNENQEKTQPVISGNQQKSGSKANQEPRTINQEPETKSGAGGSPPGPPEPERVPFSKIIDLYHRTLPELPACKKLTDARKGYIRQRHIEDIHDLDQWERYFMAVSRSDFLMGRKPGSGDRPPFRADLEWLTKPSNFAKVAEGKYHRV
jgi:uncharacterized protein YdaU (DUF1376 family)